MKSKTLNNIYYPALSDIRKAQERLENVALKTPLQESFNLSQHYGSNIFLKREDTQVVRSYKIRGAYNKIYGLDPEQKRNGVVCASAGNHAQGVALSCYKLGIRGVIFMPTPTPSQKVEQVKMFGKAWIEIKLVGDTFDDAQEQALKLSQAEDKVFIPPFDDEKVIEGQATIALEILEQTKSSIDYLFLPIGGGGLAAGVTSVFQLLSSQTKIIGVEPAGAPSMKQSIEADELVTLDKIDKFVDGASVKRVGKLNFQICKDNLAEVATVKEGKICSTIIKMYNQSGIVSEPAGALSIAVLDDYREEIKGKNVVCILSGGNNDITRTEEIRERALLYEGLKHYFIIKFPQRAGALKEFVEQVLAEHDDIVYFEYHKKNSREKGPALVGIELNDREDLGPMISRMKSKNFYGEYLNDKPDLLYYLI